MVDACYHPRGRRRDPLLLERKLQLRKQAGRRGAAGSRRLGAGDDEHRIVAYVLWGYLGMGRAPIFPLPDLVYCYSTRAL